MKTCRGCGIEKPLDEFYKASASTKTPDGFRARRVRQKESGKRRAYRAVDWAIESGRLVRTGVCSVCRTRKSTHMHHHAGYDEKNWLNVVEICPTCHAAQHRAEANHANV